MAKQWHDPVRLSKFWRVCLPTFEVGCAAVLSAIFFWYPTNDPVTNFRIRVAGVGIAAAMILVAIISRVLAHWGNPEKPFIECLLKELSREIWRVDLDDLKGPIERHRITLFRTHRRSWIFWMLRRLWRLIPPRKKDVPKLVRSAMRVVYTHKLVPCLRIPASSRRPERVFYVNEHYEDCCQGVAGLVFAKGRVATVELPDLHAPESTNGEFDEYARLTHDDVEIVRAEKYYAKRIAGVTIYVDGLRWGILVLDSIDPAAIDEQHLDGPAMKRTLGILTAILEEGLAA